MIDARDIAHHLGMTVRYGGGVRRFYSVAEHCVFVADLLAYQGKSREIIKAGLLHDAAEAYLGDIIAPLKYTLRAIEYGKSVSDNGIWFDPPPKEHRGVYGYLTEAIDHAVADAFEIDVDLLDHPDVKLADMWALKIEAAELTFNGGKDWRYPGTIPNGGELPPVVFWDGGMAPEVAGDEWLYQLGELDA
jgi:hypothetical protein